MVTRETAKKITLVCDEISDCKEALEMFGSKFKLDIPSICISKKNDETGTYILLDFKLAKETIKKQLVILQALYTELNGKAVEEAINE